jgi:pyruvate dehydrogenase E2 component (dihydrolipoamide acetyltransferase)
VEEIFVPALGMAMEEALLVAWLKEPGDRVEAGESVAEVETDKTTLELSATTAGRLGAHRAERGERVAIGATVTVVLADGEDEVSRAAAAPTGEPASDDSSAAPHAAAVAGAEPAAAVATGPGERAPHRLSPRARRLAQQNGPAQGSPAASDGPAQPVAGPEVAAARASIARLVSRSWSEIPHFAVARDIAADGVLDRLAADVGEGPVRVSVTDVLVRALGRALATRGSSDVGLAVATDYGVALPVLPGVADRSLGDIARLRRAAVERARSRRSSADDTRTPLMTLSNLGTHGAGWFTGIIPFGQQGLLTVGTLTQRPVVRDGRLAVGWQLSAVLNVDHRVWDGADAADLLARLAGEVAAFGGYTDAG